jgi:hypothetical protein
VQNNLEWLAVLKLGGVKYSSKILLSLDSQRSDGVNFEG